MSQTDSLAPVACSKREFKIVGAEGVVIDGGFNCFFKEGVIAEERLGYAKPHAKELFTISLKSP